jgi:uncharacterized membrane-anchored protein
VNQSLPADHPDRRILADEVHARPPEALDTPSRVTYVAVLVDAPEREHERTHLGDLCRAANIAPPASDSNHFSADLGGLRLKWERHGEFSGYTFILPGSGAEPFSDPPIARLPPGWLAAIPGRTVFAAHAALIPRVGEPPDAELLSGYFGANVVVGSEIGGTAALAYTDFKIDGSGFGHFVVLNRALSARQAGRMLQRLFEIEAYRMMALLALPLARQLSPQVVTMEQSLAALTQAMAKSGANDEALLQDLSRLASAVHSVLARTQFRFNACRAYHDLVNTRIAELRESRLPGLQPIGEFMQRRFTPAAATCASLAQRLERLAQHVTQASLLLSTRVDIVREQQNQSLLSTMNRRAELQFRLQRTVEGLSVVAIAYYLAGLLAYAAKGLKAAKIHVDPDLAVGAALPIVIGLCLWAMMRARKRIHPATAPNE